VQTFTELSTVQTYSPDLVCLCTPSQNHPADIQSIVSATKHLFVEKPLITNLKEKAASLAALDKLQGGFFYGCVMRFHSVVMALKEIAGSNRYGRPLSYDIECGSYLPEWRPGQDYRTLYSAAKESGGVALDLIHEFDYAQWCFGSLKRLQGARTKVSNLEIKSEDLCCAVAEHAAGITGTISLNYFQRTATRSCTLICETAEVYADLIAGLITIKESGKPAIKQQLSVDRDEQFDRQSEAMFLAIEKGNRSTWSAVEAVDLIERVLSVPVR
jgi:predicted dehydrogenase